MRVQDEHVRDTSGYVAELTLLVNDEQNLTQIADLSLIAEKAFTV